MTRAYHELGIFDPSPNISCAVYHEKHKWLVQCIKFTLSLSYHMSLKFYFLCYYIFQFHFFTNIKISSTSEMILLSLIIFWIDHIFRKNILRQHLIFCISKTLNIFHHLTYIIVQQSVQLTLLSTLNFPIYTSIKGSLHCTIPIKTTFAL